MTNRRARILWTLFAVVSITLGTVVAIALARGTRFSSSQFVTERGLLVANSAPQGARVLVDGRFLTATDDTVSLDPGEYEVEIVKEGYSPWKKRLTLEKQLVTQANALLFPKAPTLSPLTFAGAEKLTPSPDGQRIVIHTASASSETNNGYFVLDLSDNPLAFQRGPRQILQDSPFFPAEDTDIVWSPDSSQVLFVSSRKSVLVDPSRSNDPTTMTDITFQLPTILSQWEEEMYRRDRQRLALFPTEIQTVATESAVNVYFSPDEEKLMYTATRVFTLADEILPAKNASSTQPQERTTEVGGIYVYDRDEDRQFRVGNDQMYLASLVPVATPSPTPRPRAGVTAPAAEATPSAVVHPPKFLLANDLATNRQPLTLAATPSAFRRLQDPESLETTMRTFRAYHSPLFSHGLQWFPNSQHLISPADGSIVIKEYDNTNQVSIYSGPFAQSFVYPWPNGSRLIILTNFQSEVPANLYTILLE
jgi:hypothetical protein